MTGHSIRRADVLALADALDEGVALDHRGNPEPEHKDQPDAADMLRALVDERDQLAAAIAALQSAERAEDARSVEATRQRIRQGARRTKHRFHL